MSHACVTTSVSGEGITEFSEVWVFIKNRIASVHKKIENS